MAVVHTEAQTQAGRPQKSGGTGADARVTLCAGAIPSRRPHKVPCARLEFRPWIAGALADAAV